MKLLIVDDEQIAIDGILSNLKLSKYGIRRAYSARSMAEAQTIMQKEQVHIVLCDIEMPGGSGLDLIEWINLKYPGTVTIILSSHSDFDFARQAIDLACLQYLVKPALPDELDAALTRAAQRIHQEDANKKYIRLGEDYLHSISGKDEARQDIMFTTERYILKHIGEELSVEKLAGIAFVSPDYLSRCFKKKHGMTVVEYINDFRLKLAEELLVTTDMTVSAIASKVGYSNYSYFIRQFKRRVGYLPSEYRLLRGK